MDGHVLLRLLSQGAGGLLIGAVLLDVFLTVLYARIHTGIISNRLSACTWRAFRFVSRLFPGHRDVILSYGGPVILVVLVAAWVGGLVLGGGLVVFPAPGTSVRTTVGSSPTDFVTALYVAGDTLTTVGTSDFTPRTGFFLLRHPPGPRLPRRRRPDQAPLACLHAPGRHARGGTDPRPHSEGRPGHRPAGRRTLAAAPRRRRTTVPAGRHRDDRRRAGRRRRLRRPPPPVGPPNITTFIQYMAHDPAEIDPAGARPETTDQRPAFHGRIRSAG